MCVSADSDTLLTCAYKQAACHLIGNRKPRNRSFSELQRPFPGLKSGLNPFTSIQYARALTPKKSFHTFDSNMHQRSFLQIADI